MNLLRAATKKAVLKVVSVVQSLTAMTDKNWDFYIKLFPLIDLMPKQFSRPILGPLLKKVGGVDDLSKRHSQGYILTLNRDLSYKKRNKNVVLPITMVERLIKESTYRVAMNKCFCRDGRKCSTYPQDFGCIFVGEGTRKLVENGIAHELTVPEALQHLHRAADLGLVAMCLWMEMEAFGMGLTEEEHKQFLEICLCCPCCCLGLQNFNKMGSDVMKRFGSVGWRAGAREGCIGCGLCAQVCPVDAITVLGDTIRVSDACLGCGLCAAKCPQEAIGMDQMEPIKKSVLDYFFGFRPDV